jgi:hypothetical protein
MNYQIIDNFLPNDEFKKIKDYFLASYIDWHFNPNGVIQNGLKPEFIEEKYNFQFTHTVYHHIGIINNTSFKILYPLLLKINPKDLFKIKSNLNVITNENKKYDFHIDNYDCNTTAIYYINTNNGKTIFLNGTEIESIENRLLIFDSKIMHTGTSCTDQKVRCLINLNYNNQESHTAE